MGLKMHLPSREDISVIIFVVLILPHLICFGKSTLARALIETGFQ